MAYSFEFKLKVVKHWKRSITPVSQMEIIRKVPRQTIYRWINIYKRYGAQGLENKKPGAKKQQINLKFKQRIIESWIERPKGSHKMWLEFQAKGFNVSQRKIQEIFREKNFKMNKRKRPSQIKFVKYEWPRPNMLWHTDWTVCPFTGKQLIAFIDDYSRFIVHAEYFENATTENTILAFANAISKYGIPQAILTDNGTQFTPARSENGPFTKWCEDRGIKHILGRVHHPQTNGKIERWFGTYKQEFQANDTLETFRKYYNEERLHQGIGYKTPLSRYKNLINVV
jgi:putative transposase